ncbi:hypothetical protein JXA34_02540 [Patescibacteria group bacterium]|nr:hypothetical protein [Patescibacteria group bacterium]
MPGNHSKNKGRRFEQELVNLFKEKGHDAQRISMLETGRILKGDVEVEKLGQVEVKGGSQVPVFLYKARKKEEHCLIVRRDREKWVICMDLEEFIEKFM